MELISLLNSPWSLGALVAVYIALLKAGVPVDKAIATLFKSKNGHHENGDVKKLIEEVLKSQVELKSHYNDETTEKLDKLIKMEEVEHEKAGELRDTLQEMNWVLKDLKQNGIRCRKDI